MINPTPLVKKYSAQTRRGPALDIGTGKGDNALFLAYNGFSVTAIDTDKEAINIISGRASAENLKLTILNQNIKDFFIREKYYTFISAVHSLNFLSQDEFYKIIYQIKKGLKKKGIAIITVFTKDDPLFKKIKIKTGGTFTNKNGRRWYFVDPEELKQLFQPKFRLLFYANITINDKGHAGNPKPHTHAIARIVIQK